MLGASPIRIFPCRGEYAELIPSRRAWVNGLIYPLPHASGAGLGVHLAKTVWGSVTLGPTIHYQEGKDDYEGDRLASKISWRRQGACWPRSPSTICGSAARASAPNSMGPRPSFADFLVERDRANPRVIQAAGIDSPGLTSSLAIGERVAMQDQRTN